MILSGITAPFGNTLAGMTLSRCPGYVTYLLLTLSPLTTLSIAQLDGPFDLHVLATPPAFVLSQDQTLQFDSSIPRRFLAKTRRGGGRLNKTPAEAGIRLNTHNMAHTSKVSIALFKEGRKRTFAAVFGLTVNL